MTGHALESRDIGVMSDLVDLSVERVGEDREDQDCDDPDDLAMLEIKQREFGFAHLKPPA